jgi:hypothetical protein
MILLPHPPYFKKEEDLLDEKKEDCSSAPNLR